MSASIPKRPIKECRPLRVVCVGAGISGILVAIELPKRLPNVRLTIFEKNGDLGGTWYENRYPGIACDVPSHLYQLSSAANPAWSKYYAGGAEILAYWKAVAAQLARSDQFRMNHEVIAAHWKDQDKVWQIHVLDRVTEQKAIVEAEVLITAIGALNRWKWPDISRLHEFRGKLVHSAAWPDNLIVDGQRVAVIGAGSSGIQIVPAIQPRVAQLVHFVRGRTWVSTGLAAGELNRRTSHTATNCHFSQKEIDAWRHDPDAYLAFRKAMEQESQGSFSLSFPDSPFAGIVRKALSQHMRDKLANKPTIADKMIPEFPPLCKRLTPGPGYLEALSAVNVETVFGSIDHVQEDGIVASDGTLYQVDTIVCATGFDTSFRNRFPIYGANGTLLSDRWVDYPTSYLGISVDSFPNMFMMLGPNSSQGAGNLLIQLEHAAAYISQCVEKLATERISSIEPRSKAVSAFTESCHNFFKGTVYNSECSSWYKLSKHGKVAALWPGSSLHCIEALKHPRFEDFQYTYVDDDEFGWFGQGLSERDISDTLDKSYYLTRDQIDVAQQLPNHHNGLPS